MWASEFKVSEIVLGISQTKKINVLTLIYLCQSATVYCNGRTHTYYHLMMIKFNKSSADKIKSDISPSISKGARRFRRRLKLKNITESNKKFLRALGLKIKNASNRRFAALR